MSRLSRLRRRMFARSWKSICFTLLSIISNTYNKPLPLFGIFQFNQIEITFFTWINYYMAFMSRSMSRSKSHHKSSKIRPLKTCRICFCDDNQIDILTNVCGCRGSLAHVHRSCIKEWILSSTDFTFSTRSDFRQDKIYCRTCQIQLLTSKIFITDQRTPSPTTGCCSWY